MPSLFDELPPEENFLLKNSNKEEEPEDDEDAPEATGSLRSLNLDQELWQQYARAKELYRTAKKAADIKERAATLRVLSSVLSEITKTQEALHNVQRLKGIELALIATLKEFPDIKKAFLEAYEGNLIETVEQEHE